VTLPFVPLLPPTDYQAAFLEEHGLDASYFMPWEQGTGKTKALIDNAAQLLLAGKIDAMLVLAPGGVHRNWVVEELPKHWPLVTSALGEARRPYEAWCWDGGPPWGSAGARGHDAGFARWLVATAPLGDGSVGPPFGVLTMSYDQFLTDAGRDATWKLMKGRRCLYVADESHRFKTPSSARQKRALASSVYAPYRRAASGTPMDKPFDLYSQVRWLDADFWKRELGVATYSVFKTYFADWRKVRTAGGQEFDKLVSYKNLDVLERCLAKLGSRVTLDKAKFPASYKRVFHPLSREQRRVYDDLREECLAVLQAGQMVTAVMALTMQLRLAQIGCGFVTPGAGSEEVPFKENPRADYVREWLAGLEGAPAVLWGHFKFDVATLVECSRRAGRTAVVYDKNDAAGTMDAWKAGEFTDLIGNLHSTMTEGFTLTRARAVAYYSNGPRLITRQQSEARTRRIGQTGPCIYADFLAEGTQDAKALERVRQKGVVSGMVLGDDPAQTLRWLLED
jgi:hypothetical protein